MIGRRFYRSLFNDYIWLVVQQTAPLTDTQWPRCPIFTRVANFCRKVLTRESDTDTQQESHHTESDVAIIPRAQHTISRQEISDNALKVLYRLNKSGYEAYLVGGGVRDLLLNKKPKDFDITTNATESAEQTARAGDELAQLSMRLTTLLAQFRI